MDNDKLNILELLKNKQVNQVMWILYFFGNKKGEYLTKNHILKQLGIAKSGTLDVCLANLSKSGFLEILKGSTKGAEATSPIFPKRIDRIEANLIKGTESEEELGKIRAGMKKFNSQHMYRYEFNRTEQPQRTFLYCPKFDWFYKLYDLTEDTSFNFYLSQVFEKQENYLLPNNGIFVIEPDIKDKDHLKFKDTWVNINQYIVQRVMIDFEALKIGFAAYKDKFNDAQNYLIKLKQDKNNPRRFNAHYLIQDVIKKYPLDSFTLTDKTLSSQVCTSLFIPISFEKCNEIYSKFNLVFDKLIYKQDI